MENGDGAPEKGAGAEVDWSSFSPTPSLNRGLLRWWWKREVGFPPDEHEHWLEFCQQRLTPNPCRTGAYENEKDAPSMGPSPIINIKKEKRETEEETKEILRKLERDNVGPLLAFY